MLGLRYWGHLVAAVGRAPLESRWLAHMVTTSIRYAQFLAATDPRARFLWVVWMLPVFVQYGIDPSLLDTVSCAVPVAPGQRAPHGSPERQWSRYASARVRSTFDGQWRAELSDSNALNVFRLVVGAAPRISPVFDVILPAASRYPFIALRHQKLKLGVVLGRWASVPRAQRTCVLCRSPDMDDEFHFLFSCPELRDVQAPMWAFLAQHYPAIAHAHAAGDHVKLFRILMCCPSDPDARATLAGPAGGMRFMRRVFLFVAFLWAARERRVHPCEVAPRL